LKAEYKQQQGISNSLKITLNGTFGKLGSIYCAFYSPDLLIAVTITGQLNLLCVIDELEKLKDVRVDSANTDGVLVAYPPAQRQAVLDVFARNAKRTGFEYEETPYRKMAMKDVNNYIAITTDGKAKTKGLYADAGLMKNPTMQVCSDAVVAYLRDGADIAEYVQTCDKPEDFMAIRNVKGGGVQHKKMELVDDWELAEDYGTKENLWQSPSTGKYVTRKSRPKPFEAFSGGVPFGRVARWYMTTQSMPPISYIGSGNKVPKTEGARVCMTLPDTLPTDLDIDWYVGEAHQILSDIGVVI
jgi:hypothetical protein